MDLIRVGRNKADNWVIVSQASGDDLWFHVDGAPSSHVILSAAAPKSMIKECARLCKQHSVVYTKIKNIALGKHEGEVLIKNEFIKV
jgi:predicted ribosome quality control (RQC) complex YloA/Tae2 family protein